MKNLKLLRTENNISQKKLANFLNVSRSTVAMWESGSSQPDNELLIKIANYFNVSIDYLLGNEKEKAVTVTEDDNSPKNEYIKLFDKLSETEQKLIIAQMQGIVNSKNNTVTLQIAARSGENTSKEISQGTAAKLKKLLDEL